MRTQTICSAGIAFLLAACATTTAPAEDDLTRSIVLHWGARDASSAGSSGADDAGVVIGLDYNSRSWDWLGWEAGISYSEHEDFLLFGVEESLDVVEVDLGGRATYCGWADAGAGLLPYGSVGVAALAMEGRDADSGAVGAYVRGGLCYVFRAGFTLGFDLKFLASSSDDVETYGQFTLQFGWSF
ncbi:MAG TPA: outer membrane beta-barrel protein [Planctomycetota bacterium]